MKRLPPPTVASLPSAFFSFLLHGGAVVATLLALPAAEPLPSTTHYTIVPIELVDMADTTNLTAVAAAMERADEEAAAEEESDAAPAPAPPAAEEDAVSFEQPKEQPKQEPKQEKPKAAPAPAKSMAEEIEEMLKGIEKTPKPSRSSASTAPASTASEAPRMSAGDRRRMTATIIDIIATQLVANGCWADHSDMADAKRLRATFRFSFARNGTFAIKPTLIQPTRKPVNDPPLNTYIVHAERALNECNRNGWKIPEDYFRLPTADQVIEFEFLTSLGAN
jgi:outer membrane biosynthesis protein TonB